jgi:hypothetical protein
MQTVMLTVGICDEIVKSVEISSEVIKRILKTTYSCGALLVKKNNITIFLRLNYQRKNK